MKAAEKAGRRFNFKKEKKMGFKKLEPEQKVLLGIKILAAIIIFTVVYCFISLSETNLYYKRHELAMHADNWMLEARRQEKNFILRGSNEYVLKVKDAIKEAKNNMVLLQSDIQGIEKYYTVFSGLVERKAAFAEFEEQLVPLARTVHSQLNKIEADAGIKLVKLQRVIFFLFFILVVLALGASFYVFRWITKLITATILSKEELHNTTMNLALNITDYFNVISDVAKWNLSVKASEATGDELMDQLGKNTNQMIASLKALVQKIEVQVVSAANQILAGSSQQAADIEEQAAQVSEVASSARELTSTAKQITEHAGEIAKSSGSTVQIANSGSEAVGNVTAGMEKIKQSVLATAKRIEGLGERSQVITEILTLIEGIADQVNLLSLNAAIEAARAGEAGRGFAVVADAIGKLADRAVKSAQEISELIKGVQQDTSSCMMSMEESIKETERGALLTQEANKKLQDIVVAFGEVAEAAQEISLASRQQASGSEQVSKAMINIDQVTRQFASRAKEETASVKNLVALVDEFKEIIGYVRTEKEG